MSNYIFNWFALPPLITALFSLAVGLWVLRREWGSRVGEALFAATAAISAWLCFTGVMYLAADASTAIVWARVVHMVVPFLPVALYVYLVVGLRQYQRDKVLVWAAVIAALVLVALVFTGDIVLSGVEKHWWGYYPTYGPGGPFLVGYFGLVILVGLTVLWGRIRETPKGSVFYWRMARASLAGFVAAVASVDFLAPFGVPVYPFGYVVVILYLVMLLIFQSRHRIVYMTPAVATDQILATMQGAVLVTTPDGVVEVSNRAAGELLGYSDSEFLGLSLERVFGSESEMRSVLAECLEQRQIRDLETIWRPREAPLVDVSVSASLLTDRRNRPLGIVFAAIDITGRKRAEEALRHSEEQLRQSQKMEAIGQLAGGIAHDFNNLLTAIIGNSSLVLTTMAPEDPHRPPIADIKEVGERAAALTKQILAFSRRQMLRPQVLSLNKVVLDLEQLLRRSLGEDIDLCLLLAPDLHDSEIDPQQIGQVLLNLAVNARDAMPDGGRLVIETLNATLDGEYCQEHREIEPGDYVTLAVSDTGIGMDRETRERLFEPFFTTKGLGRGTGLGLSTVFGIVKQSGGSISVYSEPGHGSTFRVYLPATQTRVARATEPVSGDSEIRPGNERVLVVEDEAPVRNMVIRVLSRAGYETRAAGSVHEAERAVDEGGYHPDLLLTDVVLPGGANGRSVAEMLAERFPQLRVIYMSGYTRNAVVHNGRVDEDIAFLEKPFNPEMLLRKVREVLDTEMAEARPDLD